VNTRVRSVSWKRTGPALLALVLASAITAAACGGRRTAVRDVVDTLAPITAHSVGDVVGRWESTVPGVSWVWVVKDDGTVDWTDGRTRRAARVATKDGRVLFTPTGGQSVVFTLYLLPSHRLLLRGDRGVRMIHTQ